MIPIRHILSWVVLLAVLVFPVACQRNFSTPRLSPVTPEGAWASPTPTYTLGPNCPHPVARDITFNLDAGPVTGNTCNSTNRFMDLPYGTSAPDDVFLLRLDAPARVTFSLCGSSAWDTFVYLRLLCDQSSTTLARDDDGCGALRSRLTADLPVGEYYFILDGYSLATECGPYSFTVQREPTFTPTPVPTSTPTPTPTPT